MPTYTFALTVSGTVLDEKGQPAPSVIIKKIDSKGNETNLTTADATTGKFEVNNFDGEKLKITSMWSKPKIIDNPTENMTIQLDADSKELDVVVVTNCKKEDKQKINAKEASLRSIKIGDSEKPTSVCLADVCIGESGEYEKQETYLDDDNNCKEKTKLDKNNQERKLCQSICVKVKCTQSEIEGLKTQDENVDTGKVENGKCVSVCKEDYHLNSNTNKCEKCENAEDNWNGKECVKVKCTPDDLKAKNATQGTWENNQCVPTDCTKDYTLDKANGACVNSELLAKKQAAYDKAHETEQSTANKLLGGLTTAATGIGGMQLMQGLAEQSSDKDAAADMAAYIETMRCTYGDGKQVKAGPDEIELPGANDAELMKLRSEYLALAADLKERKEALGMKPGIESETILDRSATGLYDDENIGITNGNYASLYRAQALNSESDQSKISDQQSTSRDRVKYGTIAVAGGVVVGVAGNSLINGELGEMLKSKKSKSETEKLLEKEADALKDLQKCLKSAGIKDTDKLEFANFYPSVLSVKNIKCDNNLVTRDHKNYTAQQLFADSTDATDVLAKLVTSFNITNAGIIIGYTQDDTNNRIAHLRNSIESVQKKFEEAAEKDKSSGIDLGDITKNVNLENITNTIK